MSSVERDVEFGLDTIDSRRTVEIPLRDALYLYKTVGAFVDFFHQPDNWACLIAIHSSTEPDNKSLHAREGR